MLDRPGLLLSNVFSLLRWFLEVNSSKVRPIPYDHPVNESKFDLQVKNRLKLIDNPSSEDLIDENAKNSIIIGKSDAKIGTKQTQSVYIGPLLNKKVFGILK